MSEYSDPVKALRDHVQGMQRKAEKLRRESRELELCAAQIFSASIEIDLLTDKIEQALPCLREQSTTAPRPLAGEQQA